MSVSALAPRLDAQAPRDVRDIVADLGYPRDWIWAWENDKPTLIALAKERHLKRHLEIGGGRDPLFLPDEVARLGFEVTLNDISAHELSLRRKATPRCCATSPRPRGRRFWARSSTTSPIAGW